MSAAGAAIDALGELPAQASGNGLGGGARELRYTAWLLHDYAEDQEGKVIKAAEAVPGRAFDRARQFLIPSSRRLLVLTFRSGDGMPTWPGSASVFAA